MKREIGKWFFDIAKYIVTAVILKELFGGFEEKSIVIMIATCTALIAFFAGMIILHGVDESDMKDHQEKTDNKYNELKQEINKSTDPATRHPAHKKKGKKK